MKLNGLARLTTLHLKYKLLVHSIWHPLVCLSVVRGDQDSSAQSLPSVGPYIRAEVATELSPGLQAWALYTIFFAGISDSPATLIDCPRRHRATANRTQAASLCYITPSRRHSGCTAIALGMAPGIARQAGRQFSIGCVLFAPLSGIFRPSGMCTNIRFDQDDP